MSFFEVPPPEPEADEPAWSHPPHGVLPSFSTQRAVLARTADSVLVVDRLLVYPNGLVFTLTLIRREVPDDRGHYPLEVFRRRKGESPSDDFIRFGILFSDGSKWTNLADRYPDRGEEIDVEGPVVMQRGGGGGDRMWEMSYWVWPLPPPGALTFVISWPAEGVSEQQIEIDADELIRLASNAVQIWP